MSEKTPNYTITFWMKSGNKIQIKNVSEMEITWDNNDGLKSVKLKFHDDARKNPNFVLPLVTVVFPEVEAVTQELVE